MFRGYLADAFADTHDDRSPDGHGSRSLPRPTNAEVAELKRLFGPGGERSN